MELDEVMLLLLIVIALYTDVTKRIIPNKLSIPMALGGLFYHSLSAGWVGVVFSVKGLAAGFLCLLILYGIGAVGGGDVKLFAAIGAVSGMSFTLMTLFYSILYAGLVGTAILLFRREWFSRMRRLFFGLLYGIAARSSVLIRDGQHYLRFPFMYAVLPGVISALVQA